MFLVKEFSVKKHMENSSLSALPQVKSLGNIVVDYLWIGIVFLDMRTLPNKETIDFGVGLVNGVQTDTGGYTHKYLSKHRNVSVRYLNMNYTRDAYDILSSCVCAECQVNEYPCAQAILNVKSYGSFNKNQIEF
ncbi:MAG: hypothetical protein EB051_04575, partial [Chlamydiia bacterium]|nr:hypothetical protein [Chlamydiia bacterium]